MPNAKRDGPLCSLSNNTKVSNMGECRCEGGMAQGQHRAHNYLKLVVANVVIGMRQHCDVWTLSRHDCTLQRHAIIEWSECQSQFILNSYRCTGRSTGVHNHHNNVGHNICVAQSYAKKCLTFISITFSTLKFFRVGTREPNRLNDQIYWNMASGENWPC